MSTSKTWWLTQIFEVKENRSFFLYLNVYILTSECLNHITAEHHISQWFCKEPIRQIQSKGVQRQAATCCITVSLTWTRVSAGHSKRIASIQKVPLGWCPELFGWVNEKHRKQSKDHIFPSLHGANCCVKQKTYWENKRQEESFFFSHNLQWFLH